MPVTVARRKLGRRGVEAIFSSEREQRDARFLVGLGIIIGGIGLWIAVALDLLSPKLFGTSEISSYLMTIQASLGLILVVSGTGVCTAFSIFSPAIETSATGPLEQSSLANVPELEPVSRSQLRRDGSQIGFFSSPGFKLGLVAFVQTCIVAALYSGLVDEYGSNASMRQWVRSTFPAGQYLLNWESVFILSGLLSVLVIQFLPRRILSE